MKAVKGNKVYTIDEKQKKRYVDDGYDITDDNGNAVAYGRGKTVPYEQYVKVLEELERLKASDGKEDIFDTGLIRENQTSRDDFGDMSTDELKAYAEVNDIPIGNATSKQGILKKIQEAMRGQG